MLDDDILTIEEVARHLRVSERTVYEWAQRGEIPAGKIGTVWRFKKSDIEKWVDSRLSSVNLNNSRILLNPETLLSSDRIIFLDTDSKQETLLALIENISAAPQIKNPNELSTEILKREELMSTAIGRGIAIPHVRLSSVTDLVVSVGINKKGIKDFCSLDDIPVRILIMIAAAYNQHSAYLQTLSFFSAKLKNLELQNALLSSSSQTEVLKILTA